MSPRTAQKNRTRKALIEAARDLITRGEDVTVANVADAADISRATAYRYFADAGAIATEVALELELTPTEELLAGLTDTRARVHAVARYYLRFSRDHEATFRQYLAQTMSLWASEGSTEFRGARRVKAFSRALETVAPKMSRAEFTALVNRLSMLTGIEQMVATKDVLRLDADTADEMQRGIVDAVLDRYLPS